MDRKGPARVDKTERIEGADRSESEEIRRSIVISLQRGKRKEREESDEGNIKVRDEERFCARTL